MPNDIRPVPAATRRGADEAGCGQVGRRRRAVLGPPIGSDAGDLDLLRPRTPGLLGEAREVIDIAGEQDHGARLGQRHHRNQGIKGTPVPGHPSAAEQFAGRTSLLCSDRNHGEPAQHAMHWSVPGSAPQHLAEC